MKEGIGTARDDALMVLDSSLLLSVIAKLICLIFFVFPLRVWTN